MAETPDHFFQSFSAQTFRKINISNLSVKINEVRNQGVRVACTHDA